MTYLNCSQCRLSIPEPRHRTLTRDYCPRCIARRRVATPLFRSPLPMRELTADGDPSSVAASGPPG